MHTPFTRSRLGVAAGLFLAISGVGVAAGAGPLPGIALLNSSGASNSSPAPTTDEMRHTNDDVVGPCDEAEHTTDPACAPTAGAVTPVPAADDDDATTAPTTVAPAVGRPAALPTTGVVDAAPSGTVSYAFDGSKLSIVATSPATGWTVQVEHASGRELKVIFTKGDRQIEVKLEIEDGTARARVRDSASVAADDHGVSGDDDSGHDNSGHGDGTATTGSGSSTHAKVSSSSGHGGGHR